jgi:DNA-binding LacI/PurR family transcriptional regulator
MRRAGLKPSQPVFGDWTAESGYQGGRDLLVDGDFSAVFAANDQMALGLYHALGDAGLDVPGDVSVVGFDDMPEAAHFAPPLTTVRQDFRELGRQCVARLVQPLADSGGVGLASLQPVLVERQSTAQPALRPWTRHAAIV